MIVVNYENHSPQARCEVSDVWVYVDSSQGGYARSPALSESQVWAAGDRVK